MMTSDRTVSNDQWSSESVQKHILENLKLIEGSIPSVIPVVNHAGPQSFVDEFNTNYRNHSYLVSVSIPIPHVEEEEESKPLVVNVADEDTPVAPDMSVIQDVNVTTEEQDVTTNELDESEESLLFDLEELVDAYITNNNEGLFVHDTKTEPEPKFDPESTIESVEIITKQLLGDSEPKMESEEIPTQYQLLGDKPLSPTHPYFPCLDSPDITTIEVESSDEVIPTSSSCPQAQSNEISSTEEIFDFGAFGNDCSELVLSEGTELMILGEDFSEYVLTEGTDLTKLAASSTQGTPASLPSVSSLVIPGNNNNATSMNWVIPGAYNVVQVISPQFTVSNYPEEKQMVSTRQRKISPSASPTSSSEAVGPDQQFLEVGQSTRSFILTEGIIKPRQKRKEENAKKRKERRNNKTGDNTFLEEEDLIEAAPIQFKISKSGKMRKQEVYYCPICKKKYSSAQGLKYHASVAHIPNMELKCKYCGREFLHRAGFKAHVEYHEIQMLKVGKKPRGEEATSSTFC